MYCTLSAFRYLHILVHLVYCVIEYSIYLFIFDPTVLYSQFSARGPLRTFNRSVTR